LKTRIAIAVSLLTILAVTLAYGQSSGHLNIPFKFMVGKKEMPAGKYEFVKQAGSSSILLLRNQDTGSAVHLPVIERLARTEPATSTTKVVFNTVDNQKFISEYWPAGTDDGYLVQVTKKSHQHEVLKAE